MPRCAAAVYEASTWARGSCGRSPEMDDNEIWKMKSDISTYPAALVFVRVM
jgi:hypothetical protein